MNDATHGDEVFVLSGTYNEQVRIAPPEGNPPEFTLTLRADNQSGAAPVTVRHNATTRDPENRDAVFEIYNDYKNLSGADRPETTSEDMQITIEGFEIIGEGWAAAISVWHRWYDLEQRYVTGLFIRDNYLETGGNHWATLPIGLKGAGQYGLRNQQLKWGEITNNEIVAFGIDPQTDGISTHHFVGRIANNRISGNSEGIHLGYARLDPERHEQEPYVVNELVLNYEDTIIEHNLLYCHQRQNGIHFVHASKGIVRNNLVVRNVRSGVDQFGKPLVARGIHVGEPPNPNLVPQIQECIDDPDECYDQAAVGDDVFGVQVTVHNNTIEHIDGPGLFVHELAEAVIRNNIVHKTALDGSGFAGIEIQQWDPGDWPPLQFWDSNYNLLHANGRDYEDEDVLAGDYDLHDNSGKPNAPRFQFIVNQGAGTDSVSFMLKTYQGVSPCYPLTVSSRSDAIDKGEPGITWYDAEGGPGLEDRRADIGAYGGPNNFWDPNEQDPCLEYLEGVGQCVPQ
ncbi:MAG: hypothetical protein CME06_10235 [Gemmatimonadetes bacterium]|nr:hypothetical protein [Gemmatimonadota bacterium]